MRKTAIAAVCAAGVALLMTGCTQEGDTTEIVTFTDEHGRACTGAVITDDKDGDREMVAVDCDYPPVGEKPGSTTYIPLPKG